MTVIQAWLDEVAQSSYGWPESLHFTYDTTRRLLAEGVQGDLVECGVANGVHPAVMERAIRDAAVGARAVHLFDSFVGLPHAGPNDHDFQQAGYGDGTGRLDPVGVSACGITDVQANLERWGCDLAAFRFYPGWFQETVAEAAATIGPIAFLRLDGDLYDSTLVCLQHLYPLVTSGGVVVVDDWNLDGCRQAVRDYFTSDVKPWVSFIPAMSDITDSGDVWWTKP